MLGLTGLRLTELVEELFGPCGTEGGVMAVFAASAPGWQPEEEREPEDVYSQSYEESGGKLYLVTRDRENNIVDSVLIPANEPGPG